MKALVLRPGFLILGLLAPAALPGLGSSLGAQSTTEVGEARTLGKEEALTLERWARERLRELEMSPAPEGGGTEAETERLWALYFLSVSDKDRLEEAEELATLLRERTSSGAEGARSVAALSASLEVVRAKHSRWPPNKLKHLRAGVGALDQLVAEAPDDLRVRYLRLASCFYLPFFLKREDSVKEDMAVLVSRLPEEPGAFPAYLYRGVAQFLLDNGDMTLEARDRIREAIR